MAKQLMNNLRQGMNEIFSIVSAKVDITVRMISDFGDFINFFPLLLLIDILQREKGLDKAASRPDIPKFVHSC